MSPSNRSAANTVMKGEEVIDLPIADLVGHDEHLVPIDRLDSLFATSTSGNGQSQESGSTGDGSDRGALDATGATDESDAADESELVDPEVVFQEGWEAGRRDTLAALEEARRLDASMVDGVVRALASVEEAIDRAGATRKQASVELALEVARLVLDRELAVADNPGRDALVRCLTEVPIAKRAVFRFHPADLARLNDGRELLAGRSSELVADPSVACGDVLVDIDGGLIDGGLTNALERVAEVLRA